MKRSIIIAKCIGLSKANEKIYAIFDKPLSNLCRKFISISNKESSCLGTLLPNDLVELHYDNIIRCNNYYRIGIFTRELVDEWDWEIIPQSIEDYKEETVLLWQELGSLVDPPIEAIDLYIEELNRRT